MGYLGLTPTTAQQNYLNIDDISGSFNGSTTSFALQVGSVAPTPFPVTNSCLISVGGVIQEPDDTGTSGFRISGGNIIFSSAPGTGEDFFGLVLAGADYLNIGANFPDGTVGTPSITFDSDTNTGIYHPSADELSIVTGGTDRVRVDSNGRLGIGTVSPQRELHVQGATNGTIRVQAANSATSQVLFSDSDAEIRGRVGYYHPDDALDFYSAGQEGMRIDSSGRLLVGTSTAAGNNILQLEGSASGDSEWAGISLRRGIASASLVADQYLGAIAFQSQGGGEGAVIRGVVESSWTSSSHPSRLTFETTASGSSSSTERLRITSDGTLQLRNSPGIDFSQIQTNASGMTSETLDSYEEGTWTPGFQLSSQAGSFTYSGNRGGRYTKIGRVVHINGLLEWTNHNLTSGSNLQLTGLPFSTVAGNPARSGISISYSANPFTGITVYQHAIRSESAATYMTFNYANATDGSIDNVPNYTQVSTSGSIMFFGMYIV